MSTFETKNFGVVSCTSDALIQFPSGLPGFEERRQYVALQFADSKPLTFLQSIEDPDLCFITLPVLAIEPAYRLQLDAEASALLGFPLGHQPRIGSEVLCLAIISLEESGPTANLLAPVVVNIANLQAVQAVSADTGYSHQHPLLTQETAVCS